MGELVVEAGLILSLFFGPQISSWDDCGGEISIYLCNKQVVCRQE